MKLKSFFILLLILLSFQKINNKRICKTQILRSFELHSRITPNYNNSLCGNIEKNCCTKHDQMKMHKTWNEEVVHSLENYYSDSIKKFEDFVSGFVQRKDDLLLKEIIIDFKKSKPEPTKEVISHLEKIEKQFNTQDQKYYIDAARPVSGMLKAQYKQTIHIRKSLYCSLCNWSNHEYINNEILTITYNEKFCKSVIAKNIDLWSDKYVEIYNLALLMDEFVYIVSNLRLIPNKFDRGILHKYRVVTKACVENQADKENCLALCKEYNVNRKSYLFDGEQKFIDVFLEEFNKIYDVLISKDRFNNLFLVREDTYINTDFFKTSILNKKLPESKEKKEIEENPLSSVTNKSFIEVDHHFSPIQIETLDDEYNPLGLYKMVDQPIDISDFIVKIDETHGIDPFQDGKAMYFDVPSEGLLATLDGQGKNPLTVNEIIEDSVKNMLDTIEIFDMANFVNDCMLEFDKVVNQKKQEEKLKMLKMMKVKKMKL